MENGASRELDAVMAVVSTISLGVLEYLPDAYQKCLFSISDKLSSMNSPKKIYNSDIHSQTMKILLNTSLSFK